MDIEQVVSMLQEVAEAAAPPDFEQRFGYPPGDNHVVLARDATGAAALQAAFPGKVPPDVAAFFTAVSEVSLPDVWNAYFIGPVSWTIELHKASEPRYVRFEDADREVMILASNVGGDMFGLLVAPEGSMLAIPAAGIENGVHRADTAGAPGYRPIADTFGQFLQRLAQAALAGEPDPFDPHRR
ncbi:hypothetical protein [Actinomadura sp. NPDC048394]|uniref:hypothetical protein n=1 Tax=Actinomadura sp. NPDC048394 TaxID=3158223 RepID=UPI0033EB2CA3